MVSTRIARATRPSLVACAIATEDEKRIITARERVTILNVTSLRQPDIRLGLSALRPRTVPFAVAFSDKVLRRNFKNVSCAGRHKIRCRHLKNINNDVTFPKNDSR